MTPNRPAPVFPPRGETVPLPYNMVWGDTQQRLAALFAGVGAKITDKKAAGPKEVWTVEGLIAPDLQTSLFTFSGGMLAAMEFDYGQPEWDLPKYNDKMGLFRRVLESKCGGAGNMISRDTKQEPNSPVKESLMGYQWERGDTTVQLFYFSAEDTSKNLTFRTISVHYHYKDPMQDMDQSMPDNGGGPVDPNSNPLFGGSGRLPAGGNNNTGGGNGTPAPSPSPAVPSGTPAPSASPDASPTASPDASPAASPATSPTTPSPSPARGKKAKPAPPENDPLPQ